MIEPTVPMAAQEENDLVCYKKRADLGRRAISKGNVLAYRDYGPDFMSLVDQEKACTIQDAIASLGLSADMSDSLAWHVAFHTAQMYASKDFEKVADKGNSLRHALTATCELIEALRTVSGHPALRSSFNIALGKKLQELLERAETRLIWETTEEKARDLKTLVLFGSFSEIADFTLSALLMPIAELIVRLDSANLVKNSSEYRFVFEVARAWWAYTKRIPTVSRAYDRESERTPRQPSFQQFIEAIAPEIGSDTIRTALAAFKAVLGSETHK